jgi:hypothetical protein
MGDYMGDFQFYFVSSVEFMLAAEEMERTMYVETIIPYERRDRYDGPGIEYWEDCEDDKVVTLRCWACLFITEHVREYASRSQGRECDDGPCNPLDSSIEPTADSGITLHLKSPLTYVQDRLSLHHPWPSTQQLI